ncbi:MAG: nitronate monooxygenase [bacterium]|nr:nitronate monooxygenase [bacterium]
MSSALKTPLCEILGIRYPIIQTGMGWVATPELTAAVSNAGGIGFLAAATLRPQDVDAEIQKVKALTDQPFGVNFLMDAPGADVITEAIVRNGVKAAGYNRAPSAELIDELKRNSVVCVPTCGAVKHALKAQKLGADVIIVQGTEGGGHTGSVPTTLLVSSCADSVDVPVVAAGGIHDGRGLVAALAFGAQGIAMGTRFVLTHESPVPKATTDLFLESRVEDAIITSRIDGMPQRVVVNELVRKLESSNAVSGLWLALRSALAFRRTSGASLRELLRSALSMRRNQRLTRAQMLMAANAPILAKLAMQDGDPIAGYLPGGSVAGVIDDLPSCAELIERIINEAEQTLKALAN